MALKMRKKIYVLLLVLIVSRLSVGNDGDNHSHKKNKQTNTSDPKTKPALNRERRSLLDDVGDNDRPFWAHRGKKESSEESYGHTRISANPKIDKISQSDKYSNDPPFWGNRGRRGSSEENDIADEYGSYYNKGHSTRERADPVLNYFLGRGLQSRIDGDDDGSPFWGNRGRRTSEEEEKSPFWGNRGRREEDEPFWGNRGRRENLPFWGNRGRRDSFLFDDDNPFWGNRGRRENSLGSARGRRGNLKDVLSADIRETEDNIENLYKENPSIWKSFGRQSTLKHLFNKYKSDGANNKAHSSSTVHDDRIYAEEPHYIIVERSSRSSGEDDPFFISRGKKKFHTDWDEVARERRGTIEDIYNSVKSDPYFIARGKKEDTVKINNFTVPYENIAKAKEFVCSTMDLMIAGKKDRNKRQVDDRGRRAVLQKLAAQLQNDPFFVSRGKKNSIDNEENLAFLTELSEMCN